MKGNKRKSVVDFNRKETCDLHRFMQCERETVPLGLSRDPTIIEMCQRKYSWRDYLKNIPTRNLRELSIYSLN